MKDLKNLWISKDGEIQVSIETEMCGRKILRKSKIVLEKQEFTEMEQLKDELSDLEEEITIMKKSKD